MNKKVKKNYMTKAELLERLLTYLKNSDLEVGDKIISERQICQLWNVNRSTLRSALRRLVEEGYLEAIQGKGYFVKKRKVNRNLQDLKSLQVVLKEQDRKLKTKVLSQDVIYPDKKLCKIFKVDEENPILELVRIRYIDDKPALLEYNYTDLKKCKGLEKVDFSNIPYYLALELKYNLIPNKGFQEISLTELRSDEAIIFDKSEGDNFIYMEGKTYDSSDEKIPMEVFKSIADPDMFIFTSYMKFVEKGESE
ncbi:GntR family transcriptional regulator [Anaerococcus rubeinfantis]|uniref:GntR family transcriptional regulator n=1 Tax=Anaerococcus rubeinfantis TaxID=1720199 RepID=UPI00073E1EDA|nr:GntR family transcriptional regulator [Anaerococcus rubeinfantis]